MKVLPPEPTDPAEEGEHAARVAELTELLGHLITCWDDERRLLARRLHDSLGSSMTALTMHLGLLSQHLQEGAQRDRAGQMKGLLNNIIETNRTMQLTLWNDKLEFLGPKAAIAELVSDWGREHGIKARASLPDEDPAYSRAQGVALLRTVEEGLRNVLAHAHATAVDVILDDDGDQAMLTVRDNGTGPGTPADGGNGGSGGGSNCHGLRLLRERARLLDGTLTLGPGPDGNGTALTLVIPHKAA
jgi:signal transduction histidine kinase